MNLLKQSILFTLVSVFLASSIFAGVSKYDKLDPSIAGSEYSSLFNRLIFGQAARSWAATKWRGREV